MNRHSADGKQIRDESLAFLKQVETEDQRLEVI